jgi:hypothetical protein
MASRRHTEGRASVQPPHPRDKVAAGVPDDVVAEARAAFRLRATGEVATLVFDSLVDEGAPPADHRLGFEHAAARIEVHVSVAADGTALSVTVTPACPERVELELENAEVSLVSDSPREAVFAGVPHGLVRLWLTGSPTRPGIRTDWFRV